METEERRQSERKKCQVNRTIVAQLTVEGLEPLAIHLFLVDIAETGLRANLDRAFEPDVELNLKLPLRALGPDLEGELDVNCRVIWSRDLAGGTCVHGMEFVEPDEESQLAIGRLLKCWEEREERDTVRLVTPVDTKVRFAGDQSWSPMVAVRALSAKGLNFPSRRAAEIGDRIRFRMLLEPGTAETEGVVRWCRQMPNGSFDIGCDFQELGKSARDYITLHLRRCNQRPL